MHVLRVAALAIVLLISSVVSVIFTSSLFLLVVDPEVQSFGLNTERPSPSILQNTYTYKDEDVPLIMPSQYSPVKVIVEESVHYPIIGPEAMDEWIYSSPYGAGSYRLGPNNRAFYLTMFHSLHCLRLMRAGLHDRSTNPHLLHCLRHLREQILCGADATLEPGDFTTRDFDIDREGSTHICHSDWREVYAEVSSNSIRHLQYLKARNFTGSLGIDLDVGHRS